MKKTLPNNWVQSELANLVSFIIGGDWGSEPDNDIEDSSLTLCIRGGELKEWRKNKGNTAVLRRIKNSSLEKRKLELGDILLEISGGGPDQPVGRTVYIDKEVLDFNADIPKICTNFFRQIRLYTINNSKYVNSYLQYFYIAGDITNYQGGSNNLRNLKYKDYETIQIPLPPLPEQERIANKLDVLFTQLDGIRVAMEHIPTLLKNFRQQVLTQAVTGKLTEEWREDKELEDWRKVLFGDLMIDKPKNGAYYPQNLYGKGTKIIRIDNFYDGVLKDWEGVKRVEIPEKDLEIYELKKDNILVNRVNSIEYLGKCLHVLDLPEDTIFESNMMRITLKKDIVSPSYIRTFLISNIGLKELRKTAKHAVNQASINQTDVKNVIVNLPSYLEQQEIVRRVESLFSQANAIEQQYLSLKQKIDNLPQSTLHKAFKGELVEQLPTDGDAHDLLQQIEELKELTKKKK